MRAALITVSTSRAAGEGDDESGERLAEFARSIGAEAMRLASREHTPHWMLSRAVAGVRGTDPDRQLPRIAGQHLPGR